MGFGDVVKNSLAKRKGKSVFEKVANEVTLESEKKAKRKAKMVTVDVMEPINKHKADQELKAGSVAYLSEEEAEFCFNDLALITKEVSKEEFESIYGQTKGKSAKHSAMAYKKHLADAKKKIAQGDEIIRELQSRNEDLSKDYSEQTNRVIELEHLVCAINLRNAYLEEAKLTLERQLDGAMRNIGKMEDRNISLNRQLEASQRENLELYCDSDVFSNNLSSARQKYARSESKFANYRHKAMQQLEYFGGFSVLQVLTLLVIWLA